MTNNYTPQTQDTVFLKVKGLYVANADMVLHELEQLGIRYDESMTGPILYAHDADKGISVHARDRGERMDLNISVPRNSGLAQKLVAMEPQLEVEPRAEL